MGRSLDIELAEDKKAKQIIQKAIPNSSNPVIKQDGAPQSDASENIVVTSSKAFIPYEEPSSVEEACFGIDIESEKQNEPVKEKVISGTLDNQAMEEKNEDIETNNIPQDDIQLEKYSPKKTRFDDLNDDDYDKESKKDSGVDIHFKDF
ncbi:MAG TPA: hypothetical protein PKV57_00680 [Bacilli bacterium]|nr:hypothetical protein [Bacilli bacterium]